MPGPDVIEASGSFIKHHEQYDEIWNTRHRSLDCVSCHDPHVSVWEEGGVTAGCESCHWDNAIALDTADPIVSGGANHAAYLPTGGGHAFMGDDDDYPASWTWEIECTDCHMAAATKSARADASGLLGDVATHLFAITTLDPDDEYGFIVGSAVETPVLPLEYACAGCHGDSAVQTASCRGCHGDTASDFTSLEEAANRLRAGTITIHDIED